jgi:hypothetical protein
MGGIRVAAELEKVLFDTVTHEFILFIVGKELD